MTNLQLLYAILILTLIGCSETKTNSKDSGESEEANNDVQTIHIQVDEKYFSTKEPLDFGGIIDSAWFLKIPNNHMIGEATKTRFHENYIYILDKFTNSITVIDHQAQLIAYLAKEGKGPEEYLHINDFAINRESGDIVIHDNPGKKLMVYNTRGEFLRKIPLTEYYHAIEHIGEDAYAMISYSETPSDCTLKVINERNESLVPEMKFVRISHIDTKVLQQIAGGVLFSPGNSKFSYLVNKEGISKKYEYGIDNLMDQQFLASHDIKGFKDAEKYRSDESVANMSCAVFSENYFYAAIAKGGKIMSFLSDFSGTITFSGNQFSGLSHPYNTYHYKDNIFVSSNVVSPDLVELAKNNPDKMPPFFSTLEVDDNPYLKFTKLKDR